MSTSVERTPTPEQPHASELRPEALQAVETLHETIKSWAPESEYTLTENAAEFPVLFGRCTVSVTPLDIDTWDGYRLSERLEARTELSYVIDDFEAPFFRLANTVATTGTVLRCPESDKAVIVSGVNVFQQDVEALHGFYIPTLLWSSLVQSFSVQQALRETFGSDLLGEKAEIIGMQGCDEPSRWQPEDFAGAEEMLRDNGIYSNASETKLTAEFPWEPGAVSAIAGDSTSLLQFNSAVTHPTAGNGLAFRLVLPVSPNDVELFALADTLNELEISGIDIPPGFGAWAFLPQFNGVAYTGFWPNCMYVPGTVGSIAAWCRTRSRFAKQITERPASRVH
jgi:hypothetical protein